MITYSHNFIFPYFESTFTILKQSYSDYIYYCFYLDPINGVFSVGADKDVQTEISYPDCEITDINILELESWNKYFFSITDDKYTIILEDKQKPNNNSNVEVQINSDYDRYHTKLGAMAFSYRFLEFLNYYKRIIENEIFLSNKTIALEVNDSDSSLFMWWPKDQKC